MDSWFPSPGWDVVGSNPCDARFCDHDRRAWLSFCPSGPDRPSSILGMLECKLFPIWSHSQEQPRKNLGHFENQGPFRDEQCFELMWFQYNLYCCAI